MLLPLFYGFAFYLVSHGKNVEGKNACYGDYDTSTNTGWGPSFQNSCIHSGSNDYSGGDTVWYNYVLASAGTITDENTTQENPASNTTKASESVCPKGWTLPTKAQAQAIGNGTNTYVSSFSPAKGGTYANGVLGSKNSGSWWSSEAYDGGRRNRLEYTNDILQRTNPYRRVGIYIRCVPKS